MNPDYGNLNDEDRERLSQESIKHLSSEIHSLVETRGRMNIARSILTDGKHLKPCRLALMALDGAPIDQIMQEATSPDETE